MIGQKTEILGKFSQVTEHRHDYAREWKRRTGNKVIGYLCTYVPEEIIYASGSLPVRILGGHEAPSQVDSFIASFFCPFCRDCLDQGLSGKYDYLDGLVMSNTCRHMRQVLESWTKRIPISYSYYLYSPLLFDSPGAKTLLIQELSQFKLSFERWLERPISNEKINQAIQVYNKNRHLLRQLYELRKEDMLPLSGVEVTEIVLAGMLSDKEEHSSWLEEVLNSLNSRNKMKPGVRLMILGSEGDDFEVIRIIESLGGQVVIDDHCTGSRYFWNEVSLGEDPLVALATRYMEKPPCPLKDPEEKRRPDHIVRLAKEFRVQGVIALTQKFCDSHEFHLPRIRELLQKEDIPTLSLECDAFMAAGPMRTRIEAFLEILSAGT